MQDSPLILTQDIVKSSFFDDFKDPLIPATSDVVIREKLWVKPNDLSKTEIKNFLGDILCEGSLMTKNKSKQKNQMKKKYFVLYEDRLVCYKNSKKDKIKRIMILSGMKLEIFDESDECEPEEPLQKESHGNIQLEKQCFFFSKNKKFDILFAETPLEFAQWFEHLKKCCVLTYFGKYYNNLKVIGKGTFAKVILSKRFSDHKEFAVKTFEKKNILNSKSAHRTQFGLINEINIMRKLNHPNIINLYEIYEGDYHIYLVLELLKGGELFDHIIKKGHYSEKDASIIIRKLLWALEYIHEKGIMHRDIKPENLILKDEDGVDIKLADFGLSEKENKKELLFKRCGTPGYVAPEVLEDKKYDHKCDIYSAGVILYILLTGCSPFYGKSYNEILIKNKSGIINYNFEEINLKLSPESIDLLKKMLDKNPDSRLEASEALSHPWILKYMTERDKNEMENVNLLNATQENMKKFQESRIAIKSSKPEHLLIVNSPLITGRTDSIKSSLDSPMGSPLISKVGGGPNSSSIRKKVLTKNIKVDPSLSKFLAKNEEDEISEEKSPIETNIKNMKKEEKPIKSMVGNSIYHASPLGKRPKGASVSISNKPKESDNVMNVLKKME